MRSKQTLWMLCLGLVITQPACTGSPVYYAEAIEAKVIDADTKQPLEGVIVTANWELEEGTLGGNIPIGQMMVMESVTNKDGRFTLSAWGPKLALKGHLVNKDPQLLFFKGGYEYRRLVNDFTANYNKEPLRRSQWNGKTIEMREFREPDDQVHHLVKYEGELGFLLETDEWRKTPCTLLSLHNEAKKLGIKNFVDRFQVPNIKRSQEVARFLEEGTQCKK